METKPAYRIPSHIQNAQKLRQEALARRRVLRQAGLTTYTIGLRGGRASIVCLCCGLGSSDSMDITYLRCGFCDARHEDIPEG